MNKDEFIKQSKALRVWVHNESSRTFFINGYVGHEIKFYKDGELCIIESEGGNSSYAGDIVSLVADDVEIMEFDKDEYKFIIVTKEDSPYKGQGYDIEVYELTRVDFIEEV